MYPQSLWRLLISLKSVGRLRYARRGAKIRNPDPATASSSSALCLVRQQHLPTAAVQQQHSVPSMGIFLNPKKRPQVTITTTVHWVLNVYTADYHDNHLNKNNTI